VNPERAALFLLQGRAATKAIKEQPNVVAQHPLLISPTFDVNTVLPALSKQADQTSEVYRLFFVFENYLRDLVADVMREKFGEKWWDHVPANVKTDADKLRETEEMKAWMAAEARSNAALLTYPQLLSVINDMWKDADFESALRDKMLIQEARTISHTRNTVCHMSTVTDEEADRVRQIIRDWFRAYQP
jgi:hypothetical protein